MLEKYTGGVIKIIYFIMYIRESLILGVIRFNYAVQYIDIREYIYNISFKADNHGAA